VVRALLLLLSLAACAAPSREVVRQAAAVRQAAPAMDPALAARPVDCAVADRACVTLWTARGAACARLGREDCALDALRQAAGLTPADATEDEREEVAIRLADAWERRRDRATGQARREANAAILDAVAPLRASGRAAPYAAHYAAGVAIDRVLAGEVTARCGTLRAARDDAARAAEAPGLPPIAARIVQRRAAASSLLALQPGCR
jgi:hypothetical protein